MNANTAEGARKTALYFIQLYPYTMRTGDTKEWDRLSVAKKCDFCAGNRADAIEAHKKHWTRVGGDVSAKVVRTYDRDTLYDGYPVDVRVEQEAFTLKDGTKVVNSKPASTGILSVEVIRSGSRWKILGVSAAGDS